MVFHCWKALAEQNLKILLQLFVLIKFYEDEDMHFCPRDTGFSKISQQVILKSDISKQKNIFKLSFLKKVSILA